MGRRKLGDDELTYSVVHYRLRAERGPASGYPCTDCGEPAEQWSYNGQDPDERVEPWPYKTGNRKPRVFSRHFEFYEPRCTPCHNRLDGHTVTGLLPARNDADA